VRSPPARPPRMSSCKHKRTMHGHVRASAQAPPAPGGPRDWGWGWICSGRRVSQASVSRRLPRNRGTASRTAWDFADHLSTACRPAGESFKMSWSALSRLVDSSGVPCSRLEDARRSSAGGGRERGGGCDGCGVTISRNRLLTILLAYGRHRAQRKIEMNTIEGGRARQMRQMHLSSRFYLGYVL